MTTGKTWLATAAKRIREQHDLAWYHDQRSTVASITANTTAAVIVFALTSKTLVFIPLACSLVGIGIAQWSQSRARDWYQAFRSCCGGEPHEQISARLRDPHARRVLMDSIRASMDAVDDAVVVPLARLTAGFQDPRSFDAFHRGMTRVLVELSAEQLRQLRALVDVALCEASTTVTFIVTPEGPAWMLRVKDTYIPSREPTGTFVSNGPFNEASEKERDNSGFGRPALQFLVDPQHLLRLLKQHGIGSAPAYGFVGVEVGSQVVRLEQDMWRRIGELVRHQ